MTRKAKKPARTTNAAKTCSPKKTAKPATDGTVPKKMSQIDAAIRVLEDAGHPMNCVAMVEAMGRKGLWSIIRRHDELLRNIQEADREELATAIRTTVTRITLRQEIRSD